MLRAKNVETVERERERESYLLNNIAFFGYTIKVNLYNIRNKDPCYMGRSLCLRI